MASIVRSSAPAFRALAKPSILRASAPGLMLAQRRDVYNGWRSAAILSQAIGAGERIDQYPSDADPLVDSFASTEPLSAKDSVGYLNAQRQQRPLSPHLAIYQPQLTWYLSILNRMTGVALSGTLYVAAMAYLAHPLFPSIDSAHLVQIAHDFPGWFKGSVKMLFALPFTFHTFNGIRHLAWDMGYGLTIKGVYATGYTVMAATAISSLYLAFFV